MKGVVVSADSHVLEPDDLWERPLRSKYGDAVPRVVSSFQGQRGHFFSFGHEACVIEEVVSASDQTRVDELIQAGHDPVMREKCIDRDGVAAEVIHATWALFVMRLPDVDLKRDCCRIVNDWLAEYCSHNPRRMVGVAMVPLEDVTWAKAELERAVTRGLRGVMVPTVNAEGTPPYRDRRYDPFWAAVQELDVPLTLHIITGRARDPFTFHGAERPEAPRAIAALWSEIWPVLSGDFIFGGILDRFPRLRVVLGEYEVSWVPYFSMRLERAARMFGSDFGLPALARSPSRYLRENVYFGMINDPLARRCLDDVGADRILWGSDFPHPPCTYPKTHAILDTILDGVPEDARRRIVAGNVMELYKIEL